MPPVDTASEQPLARPPVARFAGTTVLGGVLLAAGLVGAAREVRALEALEHTVIPKDMVSVTRADGVVEMRLGRHRVPPRGLLRLEACGSTSPPSGLRLRVHHLDGATGVREHTDTLSPERSMRQRCAAGRWAAGASGSTVDLTLEGRGSLPRELTVRTGGTLDLPRVVPVLVLLLALALLVLGPTVSRGARSTAEVSSEAPLAPARGRWGALVALVVLAGAHVVAVLPVGFLGYRPSSLFASLVVQNVAMVLGAGWLLGAFRRGVTLRDALALGPADTRWVPRALGLGLCVLAVAAGVSSLLPNAGDTPLGRDVEHMGLRYVIACMALLAPLGEEVFFRGALATAMDRRVGTEPPSSQPWTPSAMRGQVIAAAVFTAMHATQLKGARLGLVPIAAVALVNGWLRVRTGGLVAPWVVHTVYNGLIVASVMAGV